MKALIFGAGGQLGRELVATAPETASLTALDRHALDIVDAEAVRSAVEREKPDVVMNAAAYTAVDKAETEVEQALAVNVEGARNLAFACAATGAQLVHFSTDFVFDGTAAEPYSPHAPTRPIGAYGKSKLDGELAMLAGHPQGGLVVRTSWLYSEFGNNFVKTMLRLMAERESLSVVGDQVGSPTWANGLATVAWRLGTERAPAGIYHWSDAGATTWYDFAVEIQTVAVELGILESTIPIEKITTAEYPTPAKRPAYSVLDCGKTVASTGYAQVEWQANLRRMLAGLKDQG